MSLFTVYAYLSLNPRERDALLAAAASLASLDASFKALLAQVGQGELTPEQAQQVTELIAQLKTSGAALKAAEDATPPTES